AETEDERRVEVRPGRVHVREVREDEHPLAFRCEGRRQYAFDGGLKPGMTAPAGGRLDGIDAVTEVPQRIAQVRRPEPGARPRGPKPWDRDAPAPPDGAAKPPRSEPHRAARSAQRDHHERAGLAPHPAH